MCKHFGQARASALEVRVESFWERLILPRHMFFSAAGAHIYALGVHVFVRSAQTCFKVVSIRSTKRSRISKPSQLPVRG
jgi:hypothetical protein